MSDPVRERLSAFLDGELPEAEAAAVDAHLRGCEECRQHLATLAALDRAARDLEVAAPPGYFESLPGRVRARIEAATGAAPPPVAPELLPFPQARPGPRRFALPAWGWAVAAGLAVALVTPTIVTWHRGRVDAVPAQAPMAAPPPPAKPTLSPARADEGRALQADASKDEKKRAAANAGGQGFAEEPRGVAGGRVDPAEGRRAPAPALAPAATPVVPVPLADDALTIAREERGAEAGGEDSRTAAAGIAPQAAPPAVAKGTRERSEGLTARPGAAANRPSSPEERDYEALRGTATTPETVEALRARREAWRAFALRHPRGARADEALAKVVESGVAAWRLGGEASDLQRAREDAAAYLRRADAAQAPRVRALVAGLPPAP